MADDDQGNPRTPSSDHAAMAPFWAMVNAILGGAESMRATTGGFGGVTSTSTSLPFETLAQEYRSGRIVAQSPYLPRFPNETALDYDCRRRNAPFTNLYADISNNLASKPFSKPCEIDDSAGDDLKALAENIDGMGNNLHVYASRTFKDAVDKGIDWILVDYTKPKPRLDGQRLSVLDEKAQQLRPYWVHVPAERMIAVYSKFINGQEVIFRAQIDEPCTELYGYKEMQYNRVRVLDRAPIVDETTGNIVDFAPATWQVLEEATQKDDNGKETTSWVVKDQGDITIGIIPLVPMVIGKRNDMSWRIEPELRGIAHSQIEAFQQESNLKTIKEMTAFPMLAGNGVRDTNADGSKVVVPVGPRAVLFAPPDGEGKFGSWSYIGPPEGCLMFLETSLEKLQNNMRSLGMQPLATANVTVITSSNESLKANSKAQAWAIQLKDALEQAWKITCLWLGRKEEPIVSVHMDFGAEFDPGAKLDTLLKAEAQGVISKQECAIELRRFGLLRQDYDWDDDQPQLGAEQANNTLQPEQDLNPRNGALLPGVTGTASRVPPLNGQRPPLQ